MNKSDILSQIRKKRSILCVGLDVDVKKIPSFLLDFEDPVFEFNKRIIDATKDECVAYKPNVAFYEVLGSKGWDTLQKTIEYIPDHIFTIADAKRADIGNTSSMYAKTFFDYLNVDAVTVNPYMGEDSVAPFLEYENKWTILLALTSNAGNKNFQKKTVGDKQLYEDVICESKHWGSSENMMYVVGATEAESLKTIRSHIPDHFLLIPGIGAQGGKLKEVVQYGANTSIGMFINSSRGILYASNNEDFDQKAREKAQEINHQINQYIAL